MILNIFHGVVFSVLWCPSAHSQSGRDFVTSVSNVWIFFLFLFRWVRTDSARGAEGFLHVEVQQQKDMINTGFRKCSELF